MCLKLVSGNLTDLNMNSVILSQPSLSQGLAPRDHREDEGAPQDVLPVQGADDIL